MDTIELTVYDKTTWPPGPWTDEPDKIQWPDEATGLACLMVRPSHGGWCGYVGVPAGHPLHGVDYGTVHDRLPDLSVHGGLTFSNDCDPEDHSEPKVCHIPGPGEPDDVWWLGFDCVHAGDHAPGPDPSAASLTGTLIVETNEYQLPEASNYKTREYVAAECTRLAATLATA